MFRLVAAVLRLLRLLRVRPAVRSGVIYLFQTGRERTAWLRRASFIKNDPRSGATGGHRFTRLACVRKKRKMRGQKRRLCGNAVPAQTLHLFPPPARTDTPTWLQEKGSIPGGECPILPDTAAGGRAEREDQGGPPLRMCTAR